MKILYCKSGCFLHPTKKIQDNIEGFITIFKNDANSLPHLGFVSKSDINSSLSEHLDKLDLFFIKNSIIDYKYNSSSVTTEIPLDISSFYYNISLDSIHLIQFRKPSKFYKGSILIKLLNQREFVIFLHDDASESTKYIRNYKIKVQYNPFNEHNIYWGGEDLKKCLIKLTPMMKNAENVYLLNMKPKTVDLSGDSFSSETKSKKTEQKSLWDTWESTKWSLLAKFADLSVKITDKDNLKSIQSHENVKWVLKKVQEITPQESKDFLYNQQQYLKIWADRVIKDNKKLSKISQYEDENENFTYQKPREALCDLSEVIDEEGYLKITMFELRSFLSSKNISNVIRCFAYQILLQMYPSDSSFDSRTKIYKDLKRKYNELPLPHDQEHNFQILKDVYRLVSAADIFAQTTEEEDESEDNVDWALTNLHLIKIKEILQKLTNDDVGYVQGMSDLIVPIYLLFPNDEVTVYYCMKGLFDVIGLRSNFREDQSGITSNLEDIANLVEILIPELMKKLKQISGDNFVFVYRMILVLFTRESFSEGSADLMKFWDYTIAGFRKSSQVWIVLAILNKHKEKILSIEIFDELFVYFNTIKIEDADEILLMSEWLFMKYFETVNRFDLERLKWPISDTDQEEVDPLGTRMRRLLEQPLD